MPQINLHTTPEFEQQLSLLMRLKSLPSKSEAIRVAVAAQAKAAQQSNLRRDFSALVGMFKPKQTGRFSSDTELWEKDSGHGG